MGKTHRGNSFRTREKHRLCKVCNRPIKDKNRHNLHVGCANLKYTAKHKGLPGQDCIK